MAARISVYLGAIVILFAAAAGGPAPADEFRSGGVDSGSGGSKLCNGPICRTPRGRAGTTFIPDTGADEFGGDEGATGHKDIVIVKPKVKTPIEGVSPDERELMPAMDGCLQESGLTYYDNPTAMGALSDVFYDRSSGTILYNPVFLREQALYARAFWLANAFGAHVVNLEQQRYGVNRSPAEGLAIRDYITGYLVHCLVFKGILPMPKNLSASDPRLLYKSYIQGGTFVLPGDPPRLASNLDHWKDGWKEYGEGLAPSLRHDPAIPPTKRDTFSQ